MKTLNTPFGRLLVCDHERIFEEMLAAIRRAESQARNNMATIGLSGGSTPKAFYLWCTDQEVLKPGDLPKAIWSVSDERCVSLRNSESNFGNADRLFLRPLGIAEEAKMPWPVDMEPEEAAEDFCEQWEDEFGSEHAFDLCFCGMGDDCHTLSLFPGSPLLEDETTDLFAAVDAGAKGWRLTLTPAGLECCGEIIVTVTGEAKADALAHVMSQSVDEVERPIQVLARVAPNVTWLVDEEAASGLREVEFFRAQLS